MNSTSISSRQAGLIAGLGLLAMAGLAGWANFAVVEQLVVLGDAGRTARQIAEHGDLFRLGVSALAIVAGLDVLVAWALWVYFISVDRPLSTITAWARLLYTAIFAYAIAVLAMRDGDLFRALWDGGLIVFGIHLALVGVLSWKSSAVPKWIAVSLVISGVGYAIDSIRALAFDWTGFKLSSVTFIGEVLLMGFLLVVSLRSDRSAAGHTTTRRSSPAPGRVDAAKSQ